MFNFFKKLLGISSSEPQETVAEILTPPKKVVITRMLAPESNPDVIAHRVAERAKDAKGRFKADDPSTPDVNEAWKGGKAPAKKVKAISVPIKEGTQRTNVKKPNSNSPKPKAPPAPKAKK